MLSNISRRKVLVSVSVLVLSFVFSTLLYLGVAASDKYQMSVDEFKGDRTSEEWTYPTEEGKIFAGWYKDAEYTTPYTGTKGKAYAKFVDAKVLTVKKQLNSSTSLSSEKTDIRFLTGVDSANYEKIVFDVSVPAFNKTYLLEAKEVYSSVLADTTSRETVAENAQSVFGTNEAKYFAVHTLAGVPDAAFKSNFTVTPSWYTLDGTKVTGTTSTFTVNDTIVNTLPEGSKAYVKEQGTGERNVEITQRIAAGSTIRFDIETEDVESVTVFVLDRAYTTTLYGQIFNTDSAKHTVIVEDIKNDLSGFVVKVIFGSTVAASGKQEEKLFVISNINKEDSILPTFFSDGMMFQQKKPMNLWGYGEAQENVTAKLYNGNSVVDTKETTVSSEGEWKIAFEARDGSYDTYRIEICVGDDVTEVIKDVLIGELWIAAGQSNMELTVAQDMNSEELLADANNQNIRIFLTPTWPYGSGSPQPATPQADVPGAFWGYGNNATHVSQTSSVGWVFAKNLQEELNVPVGIFNIAVGGYPIEAWLSPQSIEGDETVKEAIRNIGWYFTEEQFSTLTGGYTSTIYNQKVGPLEGMNIAGTIWYLGESNISRPSIYAAELDLLKRSWSEAFGFENGDMPLIITQIAPYNYGRNAIARMSKAMENAWKLSVNKNTAMLTIYDISLEHMKDGVSSDPIHPRTKTPVGERFCLAAVNMIYDGDDEYTAPIYKSMEIKDGAIYISFERVGNTGLKTTDSTSDIHGFAIAGEDGIYVNAKAKIVDTDTVKVWSDYVENPKNVTYALDNFNQSSNLCNSVMIPASPFCTLEGWENANIDSFFVAQDWMYADQENVWVRNSANVANNGVGYSPAFSITGGTYSYDTDIYEEGKASLKVTYEDDFSVSPILSYESIVQDWSKFKYLSVSLRNTNKVNISMKIVSDGTTYRVPTVDLDYTYRLDGTGDTFEVVTFDLTALGKTILSSLSEVTFVVTTDQAGEMYFDNFQFGMTYAYQQDSESGKFLGSENCGTGGFTSW